MFILVKGLQSMHSFIFIFDTLTTTPDLQVRPLKVWLSVLYPRARNLSYDSGKNTHTKFFSFSCAQSFFQIENPFNRSWENSILIFFMRSILQSAFVAKYF